MKALVKITPFLIGMIFLSESTVAQEHDWANFKRYDEQNKAMSTPTNVVFYGNSITEMWVAADPDFFTKNNFIGRGISGQTTAEMLVRFRADVINLHPKIVVILAGTNDIACNNGYISPENILGNIISMTELAKQNNIEAVLCSVLPAKQFPWRKELKPAKEVIKLNSMIKTYAEKNGIAYVDYYTALADKDGGLPKTYAEDGIHPNLGAYKIMEGLILKAINK